MYKTTRAGCTTSLNTECLYRKETFLTVEPTNKIVDKTVIEDAKKYSNNPNCRIVKVAANKECLFNQAKYNKYPEFEKLPFLPLPHKCGSCEYFNTCRVTEIHRVEEFDGIVITYDKLASLMRASFIHENKEAEKVIAKLASVDNIIFDEVHTLQYHKTESLSIYGFFDESIEPVIDTKKYECLVEGFPYLFGMVNKFKELLDSQDLLTEARNLLYSPNDSSKLKLQTDISELYKNFFPDECISGHNNFFAIYSEIVNLAKNLENYELVIEDILLLWKILSLTNSKKHVLVPCKKDELVTVDLVAITYIRNLLLREFCMLAESKRFIMTSATICNFDYSFFVDKDVPIKELMFGPSGDPMNTNSKMLVLADRKKYHSKGERSFLSNIQEILDNIQIILDYWGESNCLIIAINQEMADVIKCNLKQQGYSSDVLYYNSDKVMGVASDARMMITIGLAYKPSDAHDVAESSKEKSNILREESVQCDSFQAHCRVKDPNGVEPSVVFALGCSYQDCVNAYTWGTGRTVEIGEYRNGQPRPVSVNVDKAITRPSIKKMKNFDQGLIEAAIHTGNKKVVTDILVRPLYNVNNSTKYNSGFKARTVKILSPSSLLEYVSTSKGKYSHLGSKHTVPSKTIDIDIDTIQSHLRGEIALSTYTLHNIDKVRWVCFIIDLVDGEDEAKEKVERLNSFLSVCNISFMQEYCGTLNSYRIWIFLEPVTSKAAKKFCGWIVEKSGVECDTYPKKTVTNKNGPGDPILLPFVNYINNMRHIVTCINGICREQIEEYRIGIVDISEIDAFKEQKNVNNMLEQDNKIKYSPL